MYPARESDLRILFKPIPGCGEGGCHARVWLPASPLDSMIDVVLMYHGGGFGFGQDSDVPAPEVDYLLSKGAVVVSAQYRLGPHALFPDIVDDLCDAYAWVWKELVKHLSEVGGIRGVAMEGWSAGAASCCMAAAYCAKRGRPRPSAIFLHYGWLDFNQGITSSKSDGAYELEDLLAEPVSTGMPLAQGNVQPPSLRMLWLRDVMNRNKLPLVLSPRTTSGPTFSAYNPIDLVTSDFPPTYVLVATKDDLIPAKQSYDFITKLRQQGVPHGVAEADMVHGRSENTPAEEKADYDRWFEQAIRPGLDYVLSRLSGRIGRQRMP